MFPPRNSAREGLKAWEVGGADGDSLPIYSLHQEIMHTVCDPVA